MRPTCDRASVSADVRVDAWPPHSAVSSTPIRQQAPTSFVIHLMYKHIFFRFRVCSPRRSHSINYYSIFEIHISCHFALISAQMNGPQMDGRCDKMLSLLLLFTWKIQIWFLSEFRAIKKTLGPVRHHTRLSLDCHAERLCAAVHTRRGRSVEQIECVYCTIKANEEWKWQIISRNSWI